MLNRGITRFSDAICKPCFMSNLSAMSARCRTTKRILLRYLPNDFHTIERCPEHGNNSILHHTRVTRWAEIAPTRAAVHRTTASLPSLFPLYSLVSIVPGAKALSRPLQCTSVRISRGCNSAGRRKFETRLWALCFASYRLQLALIGRHLLVCASCFYNMLFSGILALYEERYWISRFTMWTAN